MSISVELHDEMHTMAKFRADEAGINVNDWVSVAISICGSSKSDIVGLVHESITELVKEGKFESKITNSQR